MTSVFYPPAGDRNIIALVKKTIASGGVAAIPTDTCYGLATDSTNLAAIERLYKIKRRPIEKAISCIFRDVSEAAQWAEIDFSQRKILEKYLPGFFTFLLKPTHAYPLKSGLVGVRVPDFNFTRKLSLALGFPYTATSANISGLPACYSKDEFLGQVGDKAGGGVEKTDVCLPDLFVDAGVLPRVSPSTVVDLTVKPLRVLRQGGGEFIEKG